MFELEEIINIIQTNVSWFIVILLIFLVLYFLLNPEKAEKWGSILLRVFSFVGKKVEQQYISKDIQFKLNSFGKEINNECKDLIPYKIEIKFINPASFRKDSYEH